MKTVADYMALPYTIQIIRSEEGSYFVSVKELPGCISVGDTPAEAYDMINEAMEGWLSIAIDDDLKIPVPVEEKVYSGKFQIRIPKSLHKDLVLNAAESEVSLNSLVCSLLSSRNAEVEAYKRMNEQLIFQLSLAQSPRKEFSDTITLTQDDFRVVSFSDIIGHPQPKLLAGCN